MNKHIHRQLNQQANFTEYSPVGAQRAVPLLVQSIVKQGIDLEQGTARCAPTARFDCRQLYSSYAGFTLVELVVTIVIIGILSSLGGMFISRPIEGYIDLERRTELVDQAEMALRRMQRDIRAALPNSVRTFDSGKGIEFLHVVDGGRYRCAVDPVYSLIDSDKAHNNILDFTIADNYCEVLGGLKHLSEGSQSDLRFVVYNLAAVNGQEGNAYVAGNDKYRNWAYIIEYDNDPHDAEPDLKKKRKMITLTADLNYSPTKVDFPFPFSSPYQRFFIIDEAVSYIVDPLTHTLMRYSGYKIKQVTDPKSVTGALVAKHLTLKKADGSPITPFIYDAGSASRSGLVTMQLALENKGERITLLHQVHVDNAP